MGFPIVPPDTRAPGYTGHISDHNAISDVLSALTSAVSTVSAAVAGGIMPSSVQNANYTLAAADLGTVVEVSSGGPVTVTIPPSASAAFPVGAVLWVARTGAGTDHSVSEGSGCRVPDRFRALDSSAARAGNRAQIILSGRRPGS